MIMVSTESIQSPFDTQVFTTDLNRVFSRWPSALLGHVPVYDITNIFVGFSHERLKYRSIGALFLAYQAAKFESFALRFTCQFSGPMRYFQLQALQDMYEISGEEPRELSPAALANPAGGGVTRAMLAASQPITKSIWSRNIMLTHPFITEDLFMPFTYIETISRERTKESPETIVVDVLLRTWKYDWKETQMPGNLQNLSQQVQVHWWTRYIMSLATGPVAVSFIWNSLKHLFVAGTDAIRASINNTSSKGQVIQAPVSTWS